MLIQALLGILRGLTPELKIHEPGSVHRPRVACNVWLQNGAKEVGSALSHDGSMVLVYMLTLGVYGYESKPCTPFLFTSSHSWDLWMFIPLKMVFSCIFIGIDPSPYGWDPCCHI